MDLNDVVRKLDTMNEHVSDIRTCVAKMEVYVSQNSKSLEEHVERTNLLDDSVNLLKIQLAGQKKVFSAATWILTALSGLLGLVWIWAKIIE